MNEIVMLVNGTEGVKLSIFSRAIKIIGFSPFETKSRIFYARKALIIAN